MIIDAHFHIFPRLGSEPGAEDPKLSLKFWQHHIRGWRYWFRREADHTHSTESGHHVVDEPLLQFSSDDLNDMPDVNFRMGDFGKVEITVNGVDYYRQLYPPSLIGSEAPPERMAAEMDFVGVDMGILQHDHVYGSLNGYYSEQMRRFPNRFIGLAQIREWEANHPAQHQRLERAISELGLKGLYFSTQSFALNSYTDHLDDAKFEPLWDKVQALEIPVWWYLHCGRRNRVAAFMERVAELDRWAEAHPNIPAVLTHGIESFSIRRGEDRYQIPDEVMTLLKRPNMHVEMMFSAYWPEYPFPGAQEMIKRLRDQIGVHKLMWGSDMPYSAGYWCTYQQAIDYIRVHCEFLSEEEKALILGDNAARMFGLEVTDLKRSRPMGEQYSPASPHHQRGEPMSGESNA